MLCEQINRISEQGAHDLVEYNRKNKKYLKSSFIKFGLWGQKQLPEHRQQRGPIILRFVGVKRTSNLTDSVTNVVSNVLASFVLQ